MQWWPFLVFVGLAPPAIAEPVMIAPDRILASLSGDDYETLNWNGDAYQDLAVLAVSEDKDAVAFYMSVSDPDTGELRLLATNPALFPYDPTRVADVEYSMYFGQEWPVVISASSVETGLTLIVSLGWSGDETVPIGDVTTYRVNPDTNVVTNVCQIVYDGFFQPQAARKAVINLPDGTTLEYPSGPPPLVADWRYTDLPAPCLP